MATELKKAESFVIIRKKWTVQDLYFAGEFCAMGFYLKACGIPSRAMASLSKPDQISHKYRPFLKKIGILENENKFGNAHNTIVCNSIVNTNDQRHPNREEYLKNIFKENLNVELTFE